MSETGQYSPPLPQPAARKVLMHFAVSVDGFVAGPGHDMSFKEPTTIRRGGFSARSGK